MKKSAQILFVFFSLAFSLSLVQAVGISPARIDIAFEPNLHQEFTIYLINSATKPLNATLQLSGDLAPYFTTEEGFFVISPQSKKAYHIVMHLPAEIKRPGNHQVGVAAIQASLNTGKETKGISAVVSVAGKIIVAVPYPGKYAEAELDITDVNEGESALATIQVINYGLDDIRRAVATLDIYGSGGEIIDTLTSPAITIPSRQSDIFTLALDSTKYGPGIFPVTASVEYDFARTEPVSKELRIGTLLVNITNYTQDVFTGKITLFEAHLQNRWNNQLENVYAEIKLFKDSVPLSQVLRTPSVEIQPWGVSTVSAFLDATTLEPGVYETEITAYYHGKTTVLRGPLTIKKQFEVTMTIILVGVIILMLLIDLIVWVIHQRRDDA